VISPEGDFNIEFANSTGAPDGGLDFISSRGYPPIEFGYDDNSDSESEDDDQSTSSSNQNAISSSEDVHRLALRRSRSDSRYRRSFRTVLYISMEYCDKRTLRDIIKRGLYKEDEETWRLLRQILEGLVHIHGLNVVHRDLKPENIFIDSTSSVKIGDFGLATSGQYSMMDRQTSAVPNTLSGEMTKSIGTAFYVAPEVSSSNGVGSYTSKVDMYSLGVILFEMCYRPLLPGMERAEIGKNLRLERPSLPKDFDFVGKHVQTGIIQSLLARNPKERPSSAELLQGGKLPVQMESETIRRALAGLSDSESPYYQKMMSTLFATTNKQAKDFAWDIDTTMQSSSDLLLQGLVKQQLIEIFRHHGAVETPRSMLFPRSRHYGSNAVQLLDANGTLLQLPFDLTLPHARSLAKHEPSVLRSFAFGSVFRGMLPTLLFPSKRVGNDPSRVTPQHSFTCMTKMDMLTLIPQSDNQSGGQPFTVDEVDFDIVSPDTLDLALKEAEVIKVLDEIVISIPTLDSAHMCFHINHSDLLGLIFDHCRIEENIREKVSDTLNRLNIGAWSWQKIKNELRSPMVGVSATSVDDLQNFDFRGM
jgi:translation initiation factor 2-alpha kinase 4